MYFFPSLSVVEFDCNSILYGHVMLMQQLVRFLIDVGYPIIYFGFGYLINYFSQLLMLFAEFLHFLLVFFVNSLFLNKVKNCILKEVDRKWNIQ